MSGTLQERRTTSMTSRFSAVFARILKRCCGHDRGGCHIELVLRHTLLSSSRRPYDPCLGGFINLQKTFTYLMALINLCLERVVRRSQMVEHTSCLKAQCADFMGSLSCKCRMTVMCNVNIRGQAWRAFQIEGGRG